jgi:hypothetical protein
MILAFIVSLSVGKNSSLCICPCLAVLIAPSFQLSYFEYNYGLSFFLLTLIISSNIVYLPLPTAGIFTFFQSMICCWGRSSQPCFACLYPVIPNFDFCGMIPSNEAYKILPLSSSLNKLEYLELWPSKTLLVTCLLVLRDEH